MYVCVVYVCVVYVFEKGQPLDAQNFFCLRHVSLCFRSTYFGQRIIRSPVQLKHPLENVQGRLTWVSCVVVFVGCRCRCDVCVLFFCFFLVS
jgi:hypothetical protein